MFFEVFQNNGISDSYSYYTCLSEESHSESVAGLKIDIIEKLEPCRLGSIELDYSVSLKQLRTAGIFPYGPGIKERVEELIFDDRPWRTHLIKKGLGGAVEYILLSQFPRGTKILRDDDICPLRRRQLLGYGISDGMKVDECLSALFRSLSSPHFRIVKFPPWITDPEILQLGEKA